MSTIKNILYGMLIILTFNTVIHLMIELHGGLTIVEMANLCLCFGLCGVYVVNRKIDRLTRLLFELLSELQPRGKTIWERIRERPKEYRLALKEKMLEKFQEFEEADHADEN